MTHSKAAAFLTLLMASGCATAPTDSTAPVGEPAPVPARIAGIYRLQSINDQALPALIGSWDDCREHLLSAALTLRPDGQYQLSATARQDCDGAAPIESRGGGSRGRYAVEGGTIRLDDAPTKVAGAAGPGWVQDYPGRRISVETLGGIGMLDNGTLTLRLDGGGIATFHRTQG